MSEDVKKDDVKLEDNVKKEDVKEEDVKKEEAKYTDEDIDRIVNEKFARWQKKQEEEINEAKKLAEMDAQEKAEHERDKLKAELEELRNAQTINQMTGTARKMLTERDITVNDELLKVLVSTDAEETKANVEAFTEMFDDVVNKAVLEKVSNPNEKRGSTSTITKAEIMAIKDTRLRQEKIKENMHLFK